MLRKTIHIKLYDCSIKLIVTGNINQYLKGLYKKHKQTYQNDNNLAGIFDTFDLDKYYIVLNIKHLSINLVSHEIYHLVRRLSRDRNISNEESIAWLMGFISEEVYKFLKTKEINLV